MKSINTCFKSIIQAEYHKVYKRLEKYSLVNGQAYLLSIIKDNDGATQNELALMLGVRGSSMSERINKLEALGYIVRITDEENLRRKKIYITQEGKKAAIQANRIIKEFDETMFYGFSKKEIKDFEKYIKRIMINLDIE